MKKFYKVWQTLSKILRYCSLKILYSDNYVIELTSFLKKTSGGLTIVCSLYPQESLSEYKNTKNKASTGIFLIMLGTTSTTAVFWELFNDCFYNTEY